MPEPEIKNKQIKQFMHNYANIWALTYFLNLAQWDTETYMPQNGAPLRGEASARLSLLIQQEMLNKDFIKQLKGLKEIAKLTDTEKGIVRIVDKQVEQYLKLPKEFLEKYTKIITSSSIIWAKARKNNDFSLFAKTLEQIFLLSKQKADYLGYKKHPYDALLDEFEHGITAAELDKFFDEMAIFLQQNFSQKLATNRNKVHELADDSYDLEAMQKLNHKILDYFASDPETLRLDISTHPFTAILGTEDVRITTRYSSKDFSGALLSTIHEFGHALYTMQHAKVIEKTPLFSVSSLGLHESQSRFWENHIGKNRAFINKFFPDLVRLNKKFKKYTPEDFYNYFNFVKPTLIRTEADEVTYNYHVLIRYEIEKILLSGHVKISELPELWNSKYQEYLGLKPKNLSEGVLQDIHWSCGLIGYFPTYALGTVLSSTWRVQLEADLDQKLEDLIISRKGIGKIKNWQRKKIHQYGYTYSLEELVKLLTKKNFSTENWRHYLQSKYLY